ncbi:MAG: hypothetical protein CMF98_07195 [Candidatus Marinimicrobia bacterium]|nr:hypothetical protein [Candidatus Neomarinimicrobiota bacterium]|tara:strand:+ start:1150 stop:2100 length:951 start_codon:yes stop_codon:yes gene_type:complete
MKKKLRVGIIGRTESLYHTAKLIVNNPNFEIVHFITSKEAPEYTKKASDFEQLANDHNVPFINSPKIYEDHKKIIKSSNPDIGISMNYTSIIDSSIINIYKMGILNAHGGDLPKYRGNACQAWAILNGEKKIGLCVHKMVGGELDSGDIITRKYFDIDFNTKITQVMAWILLNTPQLFYEAIMKLSTNPSYILEKQSTNTNKISRCFPLNPKDGLIKWSKSNYEILRLINAHNKPYSGAFSFIKDKKIIIWDAELSFYSHSIYAVPGQITEIKRIGEISYVEVACGEGILKIKKIEIDRKIISPDKYIKSIRSRFI